MSATPLKRKMLPVEVSGASGTVATGPSPAHPAAAELSDRLARRTATEGRPYRRVSAPEWVISSIYAVLGMVLFVLAWGAIARMGGRIPDPAAVWKAAVVIFSDPFYSKGPNDQGIGWNVLSSLRRVALGFGAAAAVGIPLGFLIGRFEDVVRHRIAVTRSSVAAMMFFQPALVSAQAFFEAIGGLIETDIGIVCASLGMQRDAGRQMQRAIAAIT